MYMYRSNMDGVVSKGDDWDKNCDGTEEFHPAVATTKGVFLNYDVRTVVT